VSILVDQFMGAVHLKGGLLLSLQALNDLLSIFAQSGNRTEQVLIVP